MKSFKRKIALVLAIAMILSLLPVAAMADSRMGTVTDLVLTNTEGRTALRGNRVGPGGATAVAPQRDIGGLTDAGADVSAVWYQYSGTPLVGLPPAPNGSRLFVNVTQNVWQGGITGTATLGTAQNLAALPAVGTGVLIPGAAGFAGVIPAVAANIHSRSAPTFTPLSTRTEDQAWSNDMVWIHAGWARREFVNASGDLVPVEVQRGMPNLNGFAPAAAAGNTEDVWIWDPVFLPLVWISDTQLSLGITPVQLIGQRTADPIIPAALFPVDAITGVRYPISLAFDIDRPPFFTGPGGSGPAFLYGANAARSVVRVGYGRVAEEVTVNVDLNRLITEGHRTGTVPAVSMALRIELTEGARFPETNTRQLLPMHGYVDDAGDAVPAGPRLVNTTAVDLNNQPILSLSGENAVIATFVRESDSVGFVHFEFPVAPSAAHVGWLRFTMPISRVRNSGAFLVLRSGMLPDSTMLVNHPIGTLPGRGIDIRYGDVVYFDNQAHLNNVTLHELGARALRLPVGDRSLANRVQGFRNNAVYNETSLNLPRHVAVRLTAPANYFWSPVTTHNMHVVSPNPRAIWQLDMTAEQTTTFRENGRFNNVFVHDYFRPDNNRHERVIVIPNVHSNPDLLIADLLGQLQIQGLVLIAGAGAPRTGNVNVDARVGRLNPIGTATTGACQLGTVAAGTVLNPNLLCFCLLDTCPGTFICQNPGCASIWEDWNPPVGTYARTLHVATRVAAGLRLDVIGEAEFRSGSTVQTNAGQQFFSQSDREVYGGRGATNATATLRVVENVGNALHMGPGHPVNFEFPQGIQPMQMRYRLYPTGAPGFGWTEWQVRPPAGQGTNPNVRFISDNMVTLNHGLAQGRTALRSLEVEFRLSVEAGFEHKVDGAIEVTVSGPGVALLPETDNTAVIGTVWDPITVTLEGGPVEVDFVGRENNIPRTPVGDIIIEETRGGSLAMGDHLWIYVGRQLLPRPWDITLVQEGTVVTDNESGLQVTVTRNHRVLSAGGEAIVMQLTVTRAGDPDVPATITLSGSEVFGIVYYDEIYSIVVSGSAVARNHTLVANHNVAGANIIVNGVFNTYPYAVQLIENIIPEDGISGGQASSIAGRTFSPATQVEGAPEMIWHRAPGMAHEGGFVGLRAFANAAGVDAANISWNSATRGATIAGWDWQGNWVTINMSQGSPRAQITRGSTQGATDILITDVDIASFSDYRTGARGTVVPVFQNNRIYVPFRFVFNAFGYSADYDIERDGQVVRVIALP